MQSEPGASGHPLDIIFLSYDESNSDKNWLELKRRFPRAKRVHGVKGIAEAHKQAASKSDTHFFFVVDGDNRILPSFSFNPPDLNLEEDSLYVYRCRNPLTLLTYGYGAVKIYNKSLLENDPEKDFVDLATTVTAKYRIINEVASETYFFNSAEEAWRGAFRECFKLAGSLIDRQKQKETEERLQRWCDLDSSLRFSEWARLGARQGAELARSEWASTCKINDFNWLRGYFDEHAN